MKSRLNVTRFSIASLFLVIAGPLGSIQAQVLVENPFVGSYSGWVDPFPAPARFGNWRLSLHNPTLMETNNANPPTAGGGVDTGLYEPNVLIQDGFSAPESYELSARMHTNDDDLLGLVWNYQDPNNYFRVGIRQQPNSGTFGGTEGLAVQKIVGGVVTQLNPAGVGKGVLNLITQPMIDARTPFDLKVAVNGANYEVFFNDTSVVSGSDLALVSGGKVGFQSWAQLSDVGAVTPYWGTEVDTISVTQGANTLYSESFNARPHQWRPLVMTNSAMVSTTNSGTKETIGNFGLDINNPWIHQHSNGFLNATANNTDFIGPAVVIDEPGSAAFTDYEMKLRIGAADNDGLGVIVRAEDDNNFYRISFANEAIGAGTTRAPRGLSVQKVQDGVWSELFRDNQDTPLFVYAANPVNTNPDTANFAMFDLVVRAVGNTLDVQVTDHLGNVIDYPLIVDDNNPILAGTVGLHTWGADNVYFMAADGRDRSLLRAIPEPASVALAFLAIIVFSAGWPDRKSK